MRHLFQTFRPFRILFALCIMLFASACAKEEVVAPILEQHDAVDPKSRDGGSGVGPISDPTNGGISDDGDDQGDNEGSKKKKVRP